MTLPAAKPVRCGQCREWHEPLTRAGRTYTCCPHGTRWYLLIAANHAACKTRHAVMRETEQARLL